MPFQNKTLANKITTNTKKDEHCPNRLNTDHNSNARISAIKIIKQKLSIDY